MIFFAKLNKAIAQNQSLLVVGLDPNPEMMPDANNETIAKEQSIESLETWIESAIEQTSDRVCAYKPTLGFYQALGTAGIALLGRILTKIPSNIPVILDAKHGDLNSSTAFARTIFQQWKVDAVTLSPYGGQDLAAPFLVYGDKAIFVLCHTSNPGAFALQEYPHPDNPLYLEVVKQVQSWGTIDRVYLEVGTNQPDVLQKIRAVAPERTFLLRSIWSEEANFKQIVRAGCDRSGRGLLIPVAMDWLLKENLAQQLDKLNQEVDLVLLPC